MKQDSINPKHYNAHPSGIECIEITRHLEFDLGNSFKYVWRAGLKDDTIQELKKVKWYLEDAAKLKKFRRIKGRLRREIAALIVRANRDEPDPLKREALSCVFVAQTRRTQRGRAIWTGIAAGVIRQMIENASIENLEKESE